MRQTTNFQGKRSHCNKLGHSQAKCRQKALKTKSGTLKPSEWNRTNTTKKQHQINKKVCVQKLRFHRTVSQVLPTPIEKNINARIDAILKTNKNMETLTGIRSNDERSVEENQLMVRCR